MDRELRRCFRVNRELLAKHGTYGELPGYFHVKRKIPCGHGTSRELPGGQGTSRELPRHFRVNMELLIG